MATTDSISLEDQAKKRKERLKALRDRRGKGEGVSENKLDGETDEPLPRPVFRSYQPVDESLKEGVLEPAKPAKVSDKVQDHLEGAKQHTLVEEVDLINLAPRKPDWDLKRDISKKLEKLERRTQRAIAELIRERLQSDKEHPEEAVASLSANVNGRD